MELGGHNIPEDVIRRRYQRGISNFLLLYKDIVDEWGFIYSSTVAPLQTIAKGSMLEGEKVLIPEIWKSLNAG